MNIGHTENIANVCTVLDLYEQWQIDKQHTKDDFLKKTGISRSAINNRRFANAIPPFLELITVARKLKIADDLQEPTREHAKDLWNNTALVHARDVWLRDILTNPNRSRSAAFIHVAFACAGIRMTRATLCKELGITQDLAMRITQFEVISRNEMNNVLSFIHPIIGTDGVEQIRTMWKIERQTTRKNSSFYVSLMQIAKQRGITLAKLAKIFDIEKRGGIPPTQIIRQVAMGKSVHCGKKYSLSRALLARTVCETTAQYEHLLGLAREERKKHRERKRGRVFSPIRDEREVFGLYPEQFQHASGYAHDELLLIEQNKKVIEPQEQDQLVNLIRNEGQRKVEELFEASTKKSETVRSMIEHLIRKTGVHQNGSIRLFMKKIKPESPEGIARKTLVNIIEEKDMPSLISVRHIINAGGGQITPGIEQNWSQEYAKYGKQRGRFPATRMLDGIRAEVYTDWHHHHKQHGFTTKTVLSKFQHREDCDIPLMQASLRELSVEEGSPRWLWGECIAQNRDIAEALKHWYREMCERRLPIDLSYKSLPGLTREESPKAAFDKVAQEIHDRYSHLPEDHHQILQSTAIHEILEGKPAADVIMAIDARFGSAFTLANQQAIQEQRKKLTLKQLLKKAEEIDSQTFSFAPDRIADTIAHALDRGITDIDTLIRHTLTTERLIQWAFRYNLTVASPYYDILRVFITESVQNGVPDEDLQNEIQAKIDKIARRDEDMALDDDAPGIHQAKSKTGRKLKGANNY